MSGINLIGELNVQLDFGAQSIALEQQPGILALVRKSLVRVAERLFDEQSPSDGVWRIDRLEFDLGEISLDQLGPEMARRFERQLRDRLLERPKAIRPAESDGGTSESADLDGLRFLLRTGRLPWYVLPSEAHSVLGRWHALASRRPGRVSALLRQQPSIAVPRFLELFPESTWSDVLTGLAPAAAERPGADARVVLSDGMTAKERIGFWTRYARDAVANTPAAALTNDVACADGNAKLDALLALAYADSRAQRITPNDALEPSRWLDALGAGDLEFAQPYIAALSNLTVALPSPWHGSDGARRLWTLSVAAGLIAQRAAGPGGDSDRPEAVCTLEGALRAAAGRTKTNYQRLLAEVAAAWAHARPRNPGHELGRALEQLVARVNKGVAQKSAVVSELAWHDLDVLRDWALRRHTASDLTDLVVRVQRVGHHHPTLAVRWLRGVAAQLDLENWRTPQTSASRQASPFSSPRPAPVQRVDEWATAAPRVDEGSTDEGTVGPASHTLRQTNSRSSDVSRSDMDGSDVKRGDPASRTEPGHAGNLDAEQTVRAIAAALEKEHKTWAEEPGSGPRESRALLPDTVEAMASLRHFARQWPGLVRPVLTWLLGRQSSGVAMPAEAVVRLIDELLNPSTGDGIAYSGATHEQVVFDFDGPASTVSEAQWHAALVSAAKALPTSHNQRLEMIRQVTIADMSIDAVRATQLDRQPDAAALRHAMSPNALRQIEDADDAHLRKVLATDVAVAAFVQTRPEADLHTALVTMASDDAPALRRLLEIIASAAVFSRTERAAHALRLALWQALIEWLCLRRLPVVRAHIASFLTHRALRSVRQRDVSPFLNRLSARLPPDARAGNWLATVLHNNAGIEAPASASGHDGVPSGSASDPSANSAGGDDVVEDDAGIFVDNAGLVLLAPYFPRLMSQLDLAQNNQFASPDALERAAHALQYCVTPEPGTEEFRLSLNKILLGLNPSQRVSQVGEIDAPAKAVIESLLEAVIGHWEKLGNTSIDGLRESFLRREGVLSRGEAGWQLRVASRPYDMLLDSLPWGFSLIRLPWMTETLHVEWR